MKKLFLAAETHHLIGALARAGWWLQAGDSILDLGCGKGGLVFRLRELGFKAQGFDIAPFWKERPVEQHGWFYSPMDDLSGITRKSLSTEYVLPYPDASFSVVFSTHVIEHVTDLASFFREAVRVLKPGGIMVNLYPSSSCCVELHTFVPFYPWWPKDWLVKFAALAGIRNEFQTGYSAQITWNLNLNYFKSGVFIRSEHEVDAAALSHFDRMYDLGPSYYADRPRGFALLRLYLTEFRREAPSLRGLAFCQRMSLPVYEKHGSSEYSHKTAPCL